MGWRCIPANPPCVKSRLPASWVWKEEEKLRQRKKSMLFVLKIKHPCLSCSNVILNHPRIVAAAPCISIPGKGKTGEERYGKTWEVQAPCVALLRRNQQLLLPGSNKVSLMDLLLSKELRYADNLPSPKRPKRATQRFSGAVEGGLQGEAEGGEP